MQPDIPMNHSPYSPLGRSNDKPLVKQAEVLKQVPIIAECLKFLTNELVRLQDYGNLSNDVLIDNVKFMHAVAGRKEAVILAQKQKNYLQKQISAVESPLEGTETVQNP